MAQKKVEARNYSIRKTVVEFDNVLNKQREEVYRERNKILDKVKWFKEEYPDDYERNFDKGDIDIFEYYK